MWFILIVCFNIVFLALGENVLVTIPDGTLRGVLDSSWKVPFYAFLQIPFGKPPLGKLRFQPPQPSEKWEGILDATAVGNYCIQSWGASQGQSEDCLNLNVYTPEHPTTNKSLPVLVHIFGGGFINGAGDFNAYGPHYLMEGEIVVVSINYRVGPFGFLSTGDTVIAGNYGLKDQLLALQWVQKNIKYFNGDPSRVTIMGDSAGGASTTFHLMSKKSRGLFRAVISESGSILCPWSYQRNHKENAYALAFYLNPDFKKNATSLELLEYLQTVSLEDLRKGISSFPEPIYNIQMLQGFQFTPVIEQDHDDAFITELQYSAIKNGEMARVPLMIGICSEELISYAADLNSYKTSLKYFDSNITALVNHNMKITNQDELVNVGKAIRKLYTPTTFEDDLTSLIRFYSDNSFGRPIITHATIQSQFSDVYFYKFSYHGKLGNNNVYVPGLERVGHGEDSPYVWDQGNNTNLNNFPAEDILASKRYRTLITNFAKYLNPTPAKSELFDNLIWPKVTPDDLQFFNINETLSIGKNPRGDVISKWVDLYEEHAVKPYDTF